MARLPVSFSKKFLRSASNAWANLNYTVLQEEALTYPNVTFNFVQHSHVSVATIMYFFINRVLVKTGTLDVIVGSIWGFQKIERGKSKCNYQLQVDLICLIIILFRRMLKLVCCQVQLHTKAFNTWIKCGWVPSWGCWVLGMDRRHWYSTLWQETFHCCPLFGVLGHFYFCQRLFRLKHNLFATSKRRFHINVCIRLLLLEGDNVDL
jgi:hypothetical protein